MPTDASLGYAKLPRGMADDPEYKSLSTTARAIWLHLIMVCTRRRDRAIATSVRQLAEQVPCGRSSVSRTLPLLAGRGWIAVAQLAHRDGVQVTLCKEKWQQSEVYQRARRKPRTPAEVSQDGTPNGTPVSHQEATVSHQEATVSHQEATVSHQEATSLLIDARAAIPLQPLSTLYQPKKERPARTKRARRAFVPPPDWPGIQIAHTWREALPHLSDAAAWAKVESGWFDALDKLNRIDGRSWDALRTLIGKIIVDTTGNGDWRGWAQGCQSPLKLREHDKYGRLYFDVIWAQLVDAPKVTRGGRMPGRNIAAPDDPAWREEIGCD